MGSLKTHLANGIISLVISLALTVAASADGRDSWDRSELLVAVGISSFLSGFFTSYYAK
ncbi:MFS superfamily sulfate permease-like transporter [Halorubrum alkaliphilum]|uniref:MFS superfamily sulfate permease-like transporter n=1 Tax=Halorubrum alkaliphilum TaxID=261290 RepID=A0A8T4GBS2_9EURY|nr:hypothetical protein [Halorubrum alkaliphilum]MBP1921277.1 MFS superfamily sulfate permease-like transporter [Halorubrum alkaliphilum]